jgi:serine/threonine-protein kinase
VAGGTPITIGEADNPAGATWGEDDAIYYGQADGIYRVPGTGGTPERVIPSDPSTGEGVRQPQLLPGGVALLFTHRKPGTSWSQASVMVHMRDTSEQRELMAGGTDARYVEPGYLVYAAGTTVFAVAFDAKRLQTIGRAEPVLEDIWYSEGFGVSQVGMSRAGMLIHLQDSRDQGSLVWIDRQTGSEQVVLAEPRRYQTPRISPDGTRVAIEIVDDQRDLWMLDLTDAGSGPRRFTLGVARDTFPVWTRDGQRVAFNAREGESFKLVWKSADGLANEESLFEGPTQFEPHTISVGDRMLVGRDQRTQDLVSFAIGEDAVPQTLFETPFNERNPVLSPDGRWLTYESEQTGRPEIYVRPFPNVNDSVVQITTEGGTRPFWSPKGDELFYLDAAGTHVMAVPIRTSPTLSWGTPTVAVSRAFLAGPNSRNFDTHDGQRFLVVQRRSGSSPTPDEIVVVHNWTQEVKAKLGR